jgi:hypothetical protein
MQWLQTGLWIIGFIGDLQVVITNIYNTIPDFHNLQITTAHTKFLSACKGLH